LYDILPTPEAYELVKPRFLVRDPIRTFDSWRHIEWADIESFLQCYRNIFHMLHASSSSYVLPYEKRISALEKELQVLCAWWEISLNPACWNTASPLGISGSRRSAKIISMPKTHLASSPPSSPITISLLTFRHIASYQTTRKNKSSAR
jgi:hypothetical protein